MKHLKDLTFNNIDEGTPEGQALKTAICILGWAKFPDKVPGDILEFVKDCRLDVFNTETPEQTFRRILEQRQKKNN
jgi:hypothetical protein